MAIRSSLLHADPWKAGISPAPHLPLCREGHLGADFWLATLRNWDLFAFCFSFLDGFSPDISDDCV